MMTRTMAAPISVVVRIGIDLATRDMVISVIGILVAYMFSITLMFVAMAQTSVIISFCSFHALGGILLNGDISLNALVIHSKGDCDQD